MNQYKEFLGAFSKKVREAGAEGIVMLKNDHETLPIKANERLSVFGRCQIDYYRSGTGSGGSVNVPYKVNALDGLRNSGVVQINEVLASIYEEYIERNPFDNGGGGWAAEPWFQKEMPLEEKWVVEAHQHSDKALIIIGRTAGEEQDNEAKPGSFHLTPTEKDMIRKVTTHFDKVIVALNVSNIIDMSWLDQEAYPHSISSVIYSWQGGMEGGNALADVLTGRVVPSGKLTDTIAYKLEDYPSNDQFGDDKTNIYAEDIYVGYRYFETFCPDKVQFPFGFGLSFTSFDIQVAGVEMNEKEQCLDFQVMVRNTGSTYAGKEVVQLYYEMPQGLLGKPKRELGAFCKTGIINPGDVEIVDLKVRFSDMASYDTSGITGNRGAFVLEAGKVRFYIGNSVQDVKEIEMDDTISVNKYTTVLETHENIMGAKRLFKVMRPGVCQSDGTFEVSYDTVTNLNVSLENRIDQRLPQPVSVTGDQGYKLQDVKSGTVSMEDFIGQLNQTELETLVRGEGMSSPKVTSGTAGAFGGVSDALRRYGIPVACAADGPSGVRMDSGEEAVQLPIGTLLACTWNPELVEDLYEYEGKEMRMNQVDTLLGPGMNIHRHPLNGRNFEYFSEDPLLTGKMAAAVVRGINREGVHGTIKHYACNDQEHNRSLVESVVSERALREIHLRPFEIAVKEGKAKSVMTAYNPINGIWSASNYDLNTTVLRNEWGFDGIVMTDWWAKMNDPVKGGKEDVKKLGSMLKAQNDLYMLVGNDGAEVNTNQDDISESIESGWLTLGELQRSAMNICAFIMDTPCIDRPIKVQGVKSIPSTGKEDGLPATLNLDEIMVESKEDMSCWFKVDRKGIYGISCTMTYDKDASAQSSYNLYLNNHFVANVQLNGTWGNQVRQKVSDIQLNEGYYEMKVEMMKPGLKVHQMYLDLNG